MVKIIKKEYLVNGRWNIFFLGKKVFSYTKKKSARYASVNTFANQLKYCGTDRLPILLRDKFYQRTGKLPTEKLTTLSEKIIWASMFDVTPLKVQCADKFQVREYVRDTIGDKYLPKLYHVYKNGDEFDLNDLPDKFMLTLNCGSGQNYIVTNKTQINTSQIRSMIRQWLTYNNSQVCGEMQYYYIRPLVIARELVDIRTDIEYKLWCFGGKVEFICINSYTRGHNSVGQRIYDTNWRHMNFFQADGKGWQIEHEIPKPEFLQELIAITEKLARPFDFVRVDFYETKSGELVFGELTFSPTAGAIRWAPNHIGIDLRYGALFHLPARDENGFAIR